MGWLLLAGLGFAEDTVAWGGTQLTDDGEPDTEAPAESEPEPEPEPEPNPEPEPEPVDFSQAQSVDDADFSAPALPEDVAAEAMEVPELSKGQLKWLKPRLKELPPNPRAHTEFTAYTLDWAEVKFGISQVQIGLLPRTQIGTSVPLDVIGLWNANAKVNPLRLGPVDLAIEGSRYMVRQPDFGLTYTSVGGTLSVIATEKIGVHLGSEYWMVGVEGLPDPTAISPALMVSDEDLTKLGVVDLDISGAAVSTRLAVDLRFNRRDSIIVQGAGVVWKETTSNDSPIPLRGLDALAAQEDGLQNPVNAFMVSGAYQMDLKRLSIRLGAGYSTMRFMGLLNSFEVSYRFGGRTKRDERVQRRTWRHNRKDARKNGSDAPDTQAPEASETDGG